MDPITIGIGIAVAIAVIRDARDKGKEDRFSRGTCPNCGGKLIQTPCGDGECDVCRKCGYSRG